MSSHVPTLCGSLCAVALVSLCAAAAHAQAGDDEIALALGPVYAAAPNYRAPSRGLGLGTSVFWGVSPAFSLGLAGGYAHHFRLRGAEETARNNVLSAFAGAAYNIDVLAVVPYLSLMTGVLADEGLLRQGRRLAPAIRGALGLDYRLRRAWSVGVELQWYGVFPDFADYPAYSAVWLRASYIFDLKAL